MATTKDKATLIRLSWLTELRRQGDRQCHSELFKGDLACALGLLAKVAGLSRDEAETVWGMDDYEGVAIGELAGLSDEQCDRVYEMNDGTGVLDDRPYTFTEIADVVAGWFPS